MNYKKELILILFFTIILSVSPVYGEDTSINIKKFNLSEKYHFTDDTFGSSFFVSSIVNFNNNHKGDLYFIGSTVSINGSIEGNIYCFFSDVNIEDGSEITGKVYTLSSLVKAHENSTISTGHFSFFRKLFLEEYKDGNYNIYKDQLPIIVIFLFLGIAREILCLIILNIRKGLFEQGSVLLLYEPINVISYGLGGYFIFATLILIFLITVVGTIFSFIIALIFFIFVILGQVSLNIGIGNIITSQFNIKVNSNINAIIGGILIEILTFLPYIGFIFSYIFMPILCLGIFFTNFMNGYIRKRFYETPYDFYLEEGKKDMEKTREIINSNL